MSLQISNDKSSIPFGIYCLNKDYISYLKKYDDSVLDPDYTNRYCGPVLHTETKHGPVDYFVPIDPCYDDIGCLVINFKNGILCDFMDFKLAIPCLSKNLVPDYSNDGLLTVCCELESLIKDYAKDIHEKILKNNQPQISSALNNE